MPRFVTKRVSHRGHHHSVVAVIPIHDGDADKFLDQLLRNLTELGWGVVWHFDNLDRRYVDRIAQFGHTIGWTRETTRAAFEDHHRQAAWNLAVSSGAEWIVPHDADETWAAGTEAVLDDILPRSRKLYEATWYNVWDFDEDGAPLIRVDKSFVRPRPRFYPSPGYVYQYRLRIALPYCVSLARPIKVRDPRLQILHWGLSTPELRRQHLKRWEGRIPDGFWRMAVDPRLPITLRRFEDV